MSEFPTDSPSPFPALVDQRLQECSKLEEQRLRAAEVGEGEDSGLRATGREAVC